MSDKKISALPDGGAVQSSDEFVAARAGGNVKIAGSAIGSGGSLTPPVTLTGTDPAEAVLNLHADDAQTEHIFRVYDKDGNLSVDIDFEGQLDVTRFNVQNPPDVGPATGGSTSHVHPQSWVINSGNDTSDDPLNITKWDGSTYRRRMTVKYADFEILDFAPIAGEVSITIGAPVTPTGNAIELWDNPFNNLLFAVGYDGSISVSLPTSNPGPGKLWNDTGTVKVGT